MKTTKLSGQIMVIVLLLLSVLTVIALTATLTAVRDTKEQAQSKQYEQYYALGESVILDMQRKLGTEALTGQLDQATVNVTAADGSTMTPTCTAITGGFACTYTNIATNQATTSGSAETFTVYQEIKDSSFIKNHNISKDQDVLIKLDPANVANDTYLFWNEPTISWNISLDYKKTDTTYGTNKAVFNAYSSGVFEGMGSAGINAPECVKLAIIPNTDPLWTTETTKLGIQANNPYMMRIYNAGTCPNLAPNGLLYFRIRALRNANSTLTISLDKPGNTIPLQRVITNMTTTSNSGNAQNPTVVQESSYLLVSSPLSLFDYVLRTEQGISK